MCSDRRAGVSPCVIVQAFLHGGRFGSVLVLGLQLLPNSPAQSAEPPNFQKKNETSETAVQHINFQIPNHANLYVHLCVDNPKHTVVLFTNAMRPGWCILAVVLALISQPAQAFVSPATLQFPSKSR